MTAEGRWLEEGDHYEDVDTLRAENERLLGLLQDIEGIVRATDIANKGARVLARIRAVLGHAAGEQTARTDG